MAGFGSKIRVDQGVNILGLAQILQEVGAHILEPGTRGKGHEMHGGNGEKDLAGPGGFQKFEGVVEVGSQVVLAQGLRLTHMEGHANFGLTKSFPRMALELFLQGNGGLGWFARLKNAEDTVTNPAHPKDTVGVEDFLNEEILAGQDMVGLFSPLFKPRGVIDFRKKKNHGSLSESSEPSHVLRLTEKTRVRKLQPPIKTDERR